MDVFAILSSFSILWRLLIDENSTPHHCNTVDVGTMFGSASCVFALSFSVWSFICIDATLLHVVRDKKLAHAHIKKFFRWHNSLGSGARNASIIYFHLACECWIYMVCIELFWRANWPWQDLSKFQSKRLSYLNSPEKYWAEFEQTETLETAFQPGRLWAKSWYPGGLSKIFLVNLRRYSRTDGCNLVWNTAPSVVHWLYVITHTTSCEPTAHLLKYGRRRSIICD